MKCGAKVVEDVTIFLIDGDIVFNNLAEIRETIKADLEKAETSKFLIDLSTVGIIDSAGVGFVVSIYKTILSKKGSFALISPNAAVENVLQTVGLTRLFKVFTDEDEAVKNLS